MIITRVVTYDEKGFAVQKRVNRRILLASLAKRNLLNTVNAYI